MELGGLTKATPLPLPAAGHQLVFPLFLFLHSKPEHQRSFPLPDNLSLLRSISLSPTLDSLRQQDPNGSGDENSESKIYIGNLDLRITEAALIKMFSPFGKIVTEDFLWHTRGRKRGEPRGFAFIQYSSKE